MTNKPKPDRSIRKHNRIPLILVTVLYTISIAAGLLLTGLYLANNYESIANGILSSHTETPVDSSNDNNNNIELTTMEYLETEYNNAIALEKVYYNSQAISTYEKLGNYKDSIERIEIIKERYYYNLQTVYAYIYRGYYLDKTLTLYVKNLITTLSKEEDYFTSMSNLYDGISQEGKTFVSLLNKSNNNISQIDSCFEMLTFPPDEYSELHEVILDLYVCFQDHHSFVKKQPSRNFNYNFYSFYCRYGEEIVEDAIIKVKTLNPNIKNLVSLYQWD